MKHLVLLAILVCLFLGGCKKDIQNEDAVRRGIMKHLSERQDLTTMDVTLTKVAFRQNEADATVHFQAKNSAAPGTGLDLTYLLERKGNEWVVKGKPGGASHGGAMPSGTPGTLPPGHPQIPAKPPGQSK